MKNHVAHIVICIYITYNALCSPDVASEMYGLLASERVL